MTEEVITVRSGSETLNISDVEVPIDFGLGQIAVQLISQNPNIPYNQWSIAVRTDFGYQVTSNLSSGEIVDGSRGMVPPKQRNKINTGNPNVIPIAWARIPDPLE